MQNMRKEVLEKSFELERLSRVSDDKYKIEKENRDLRNSVFI